MNTIDIAFDVYSDTPIGKDPDSFSKTLKKYHKTLWSKKLPCGANFDLSDSNPKVLLHNSELGEFVLSSDSIGHTYSRTKRTRHIIGNISETEINEFFKICSTIGAYIVFPAKKINNQMTINGARGLNSSIQDRFDLTLECIRLFYIGQPNPLNDTLSRYSKFFQLFENFYNYIDFFLLNDLIDVNGQIKFFLPFKDFGDYPLPTDVCEYQEYKQNMISFISARNKRIKEINYGYISE